MNIGRANDLLKKYKSDFKTIIEVLALILIVGSFVIGPLRDFLCISLIIFYLSYSLYSKIKYRRGKANYILFPTTNDQYSKITSIMCGLFLIGIIMAIQLWKHDIDNYVIPGISIGIFLLVNGLLALPNKQLKIEGNLISIGGLTDVIDQRQLKLIEIKNEKILLTNIYDEVIKVEHLEISQPFAALIENYISGKKTNPALQVIKDIKD